MRCGRPEKASAIGELVFDPTSWLTAIDTLYSAYDQVMNTMEQIEQGYESLQHYYKEAQAWKLDEIRSDGDWDFRNEIRDATRSVNRQLTNIRMIDYNLTKRQVSFGGYSYTLADLAGHGDKNKDLLSAMKNTGGWMNSTMRSAAAGFEGKLSERQKAALWNRYGLSPSNYYFVKAKQQQLNEVNNKIQAWGTEQALEANIKAIEDKTAVITDSAMSEDVTEKSLMQQQIIMQKLAIEQYAHLEAAIAQTGAQAAWKASLDQEKEDAEKEQAAKIRASRLNNGDPGSLF